MLWLKNRLNSTDQRPTDSPLTSSGQFPPVHCPHKPVVHLSLQSLVNRAVQKRVEQK